MGLPHARGFMRMGPGGTLHDRGCMGTGHARGLGLLVVLQGGVPCRRRPQYHGGGRPMLPPATKSRGGELLPKCFAHFVDFTVFSRVPPTSEKCLDFGGLPTYWGRSPPPFFSPPPPPPFSLFSSYMRNPPPTFPLVTMALAAPPHIYGWCF